VAFNANFTSAVRLDDGRLQVNGESKPADGSPKIHVALVYKGEMRSAEATDPQSVPWQALFDEGTTPFAHGEDVLVVGVAERDEPLEPFVWQGGFTIEGK
jgi:hypothetical protein